LTKPYHTAYMRTIAQSLDIFDSQNDDCSKFRPAKVLSLVIAELHTREP
jgi:hypothetical protein